MDKPQSLSPLSFSDDQLTQIFRAAAPLTPDQRLAFLEDSGARASGEPRWFVGRWLGLPDGAGSAAPAL